MDNRPADSPPLPWFASPHARSWTCRPAEQVRSGEVRAFHGGLPGYAPTPLTEVPALAAELGVGRVFVKDESARLGLPAFKVLGASWAVRQLLAGGPDGTGRGRPGGGVPGGQATLTVLRSLAAGRQGLAFVAATDGNHGRAVARMARLTGVPARVFVPAVIQPPVIAAIESEGARVTQVAGDYDEAVAAAAEWARGHPGAELVQDTAWPDYRRVPAWIAEGYSTLFAEADAQLAAAGAAPRRWSWSRSASARWPRRRWRTTGPRTRRPGNRPLRYATAPPCWRWSRTPPRACWPASRPEGPWPCPPPQRPWPG